MVDTRQLKTASQTFCQATLNLQRARPQQQHAQTARMRIPQRFDGLGPIGHLLDFIHHQQRAVALQQRLLPLFQQPSAVCHQQVICVGIVATATPAGHQLAHPRRFAHLARPHQHLDQRRITAQADFKLRHESAFIQSRHRVSIFSGTSIWKVDLVKMID